MLSTSFRRPSECTALVNRRKVQGFLAGADSGDIIYIKHEQNSFFIFSFSRRIPALCCDQSSTCLLGRNDSKISSHVTRSTTLMMKTVSPLGAVLFAATSLAVLASGHAGARGLFSRLPLLLRRREKLGQLITSDDVAGPASSSRWRLLWSASEDGDADSEMESQSVDDDEETACEVEVTNNSGESLVFCWVGQDGKLHHFYSIHAAGAIKDGSVSNKHVEHTHTGHSFICLRRQHASQAATSTMRDVDADDVVFVYRPALAGHRHMLDVGPSPAAVRLTSEKLDTDVIDTSQKEYSRRIVAGWTLCFEEAALSDDGARRMLEGDMEECQRLLPASVARYLQATTRIIVNKSISYGPRHRPVVGRGACFHPVGGRGWLRQNGMSTEKEGCIELYSVEDYVTSHAHWGKGGGLLHELCHAYHCKLLPDGFDNSVIREAYKAAMSKGLYDAVAVHGPQGHSGQPQKAYACANPMEFFAELSVAYLYGRDHKTEFNKWYPHNRAQLKKHDMDTYRVLESAWSCQAPASPASANITDVLARRPEQFAWGGSLLKRSPGRGSSGKGSRPSASGGGAYGGAGASLYRESKSPNTSPSPPQRRLSSAKASTPSGGEGGGSRRASNINPDHSFLDVGARSGGGDSGGSRRASYTSPRSSSMKSAPTQSRKSVGSGDADFFGSGAGSASGSSRRQHSSSDDLSRGLPPKFASLTGLLFKD